MPAHQTLVIHVVTSLDFGGVEKHMELIGGCAPQAGMDHQFCAIGGGGAAEKALRAAGVAVHVLNVDHRIPSRRAVVALWRLFKRLKPGVVHTHGAEANFHGLLAARLAGVPVRVGEEIGIPSHSALARRVFRLTYASAHRVIGVAKAVQQWLIDSREVQPAKAVQIYSPVALAPAPAAPIVNAGRFTVGFVGRLEPIKNPMGLLRAIHLLANQGLNVNAVVLGEGSQRQELEQFIARHGLQGHITLAGFQSRPLDYLQACDLFVQPSVSEGFSLALVEAMGAGIPVIATAVGGAPEVVDHGKTGWLLDSPEPHAIAKAVQEALALGRPALRNIGNAARKSVQGCFDPDNYIRQLEFLYAGIPAR